MNFTRTAIPDVVLIEPRVHEDRRGFFFESWHERKFAEGGLAGRFVQDNHSRSLEGSLRGLHYQLPRPQGKLVRVIHGRVFDVAVDLRRAAPTFKRWVGVELSAENRHMLWIPPGFAHGFLVLSPAAEFVYKCTEFYAPEHERTLRWDDPDLGIAWPLPAGRPPVLSEKDAAGLALRDAPVYP